MWKCSKCGTSVERQFDVCWMCGTSIDGVEDPSFVAEVDPGDEVDTQEFPTRLEIESPLFDPELDTPIVAPAYEWGLETEELPPPPQDVVVCYTTPSLTEATFLADCLRNEGILAEVHDRNLGSAIAGIGMVPVQIAVLSDDLPRARQWLAQYEDDRRARRQQQAARGRQRDELDDDPEDASMWTCPKCGSKVDPSFEVCWKCGTTPEGVEDPTFVSADEAPPIEDPNYDPVSQPTVVTIPGGTPITGEHAMDVVECYQALSLMEAKFLTDQLNEQGIRALCDQQDFQDFIGPWDGNPRVFCRAEDYAKARQWLKEYEQRRAEHGHGPTG